jgi:MOSC domain-containing protein YiiM
MLGAEERPMSHPIVVSIQVGQPREVQDGKRAYVSAIFKDAVETPVRVGPLHLDGDDQADDKHHGGPDRAVLGYSVEHYPLWRAEAPGFDFPNGCFGENLSISGLDESTVCIGDVWEVGETLLEVTYPRVPCYKLNGRSGIPTLLSHVIATGRIGWFHRVLREGHIAPGAALRLTSRPHPEWTIERAYAVYKALTAPGTAPVAEARELAALSALAEGWKTGIPTLIARAEARHAH